MSGIEYQFSPAVATFSAFSLLDGRQVQLPCQMMKLCETRDIEPQVAELMSGASMTNEESKIWIRLACRRTLTDSDTVSNRPTPSSRSVMWRSYLLEK
jgi:hypothetical protein